MAYDDRDYFQTKPKFEFSAGLGSGTKGLMILLIVVYVIGLFLGDTTSFVDQAFWAAAGSADSNARYVYLGLVLIPQNIIPVNGFEPGHWKLLTHWMLASGLLAAVLNVVFVYFAGRMVEQLFGLRRFLALFIGACVLAGLCASLVDGWLVRDKVVVILGPGPGILACFTTAIWIAPTQKSIFGWPLKKVVIGVLAAVVLISMLTGFFGGEVATLSPTQPIWGIALAAAYMTWLKKHGRVPSVAGGTQQGGEPWEQPGYLNDYRDEAADDRKFKKLADSQRDADSKAIADRAKLDAILEKISASGMTSLTRAEKKFLDAQSKKKK